jgi:hypothetical protein
MTPEEQQMLNDLASKIAQAPAPAIDPEADQLIKTKIGSRPDALYVLTQTVLIQNMAIEHAQQQIQELQHAAQNPAPQPGSSFLPQSRPWTVPGYSTPPPPPPPAVPAYSTPPPAYATPPPAYATPPPAYATPQPAPPSSGHSFLRTAAITAGGVAAGALAFEGIKSLFGGGYSHPQAGFLGGGGVPGMIPQGLGPGMAPSETIVNNYYDSPRHGGRDDDDSPRSLHDDDDRAPLGDDDHSSPDDDSSSLDDSSDTGDTSSGDDFA